MADNAKSNQSSVAAATATLNNIGRATQQFIADVLTEPPDKIYRLDDYDAIRDSLFDNVKNAVSRRFPLRNSRYTLGVEDVDYDDPAFIDADEQKRLLLEGKSSVRRLRGSWVLRDANDDHVISKTRRMTLMRVPRMTGRGTFIRNGREYCFGSIMRLEPGVYTKEKSDEVTAQFNIKQGTGGGFNMVLNPKTGVFNVRKGTLNVPAYTVMRDLGITDDEMRDAWGEQLFSANQKAAMTAKARTAANRLYGTKRPQQ